MSLFIKSKPAFYVHVYGHGNGDKYFEYYTNLAPIVGDIYSGSESHDGKTYTVTARMLHTKEWNHHAITLWVKEGLVNPL